MTRSTGNVLIKLIVEIVLAFIFFILVTPVGAVLRLVKDPLRRRPSRAAASYWEPLTL